MTANLVVTLIPAVLAWLTARWIPSHRRLLQQAQEDLTLAEGLGSSPLARDLRARAATAIELGLRRRDSNDTGRTLMLLAVVGVSGAIGLPVWRKAYPAAVTGWQLQVVDWIWVLYLVFVVASIVGGAIWLVRRPVV